MTYESQYDDAMLEGMQSAYGQGFLSPGGAEEVAGIVAGIDLAGRDVLDIGCGVGGAVILLAGELGAGRVVGVDVEEVSLARARRAVEAAGLADRVSLRLVAPGPIPFPEDSFDVVFSKDVFCHLPEKGPLFAESFRSLRPGGIFACGDWIEAKHLPPSAGFDEWSERLRAGGLMFHFGSPAEYADGLAAAGFEAVEARDNSSRAEGKARRELDRSMGADRNAMRERLGEAGYENRLNLTRARYEALAGGRLLHHHIQARKPA